MERLAEAADSAPTSPGRTTAAEFDVWFANRELVAGDFRDRRNCKPLADIRAIAPPGLPLLLDLKFAPNEDSVLQLLSDSLTGWKEPLALMSMNPQTLAAAREATSLPTCLLSHTFGKPALSPMSLAERTLRHTGWRGGPLPSPLTIDLIATHHSRIDARFADQVQQDGFGLLAVGVDYSRQFEKLAACAVDGVVGRPP